MTTTETALIVGGGPGISASCARLFRAQGMRVVVAARNIDKPALQMLRDDAGVTLIPCDAADAVSVATLFSRTKELVGAPRLVVHNIDGRPADAFRKTITEVSTDAFHTTLLNSTFSAFLVGQQAAKAMLELEAREGHRGTILFTNASAAFKGFPRSGAFAAASHGKAGLAESMARELMPQGIHVAHVPIDAAIGWEREDGSRAHWLAGPTENDNMAHPDRIADLYLQLHWQHRSTWAFEVVLRPWSEKW
ncbi:MAG: SDR family oxidoreductase [Gammaproteobacteria bacterium]|nr:SDR family oxidoreductase [Gammaproteobacteria bacterium]